MAHAAAYSGHTAVCAHTHRPRRSGPHTPLAGRRALPGGGKPNLSPLQIPFHIGYRGPPHPVGAVGRAGEAARTQRCSDTTPFERSPTPVGLEKRCRERSDRLHSIIRTTAPEPRVSGDGHRKEHPTAEETHRSWLSAPRGLPALSPTTSCAWAVARDTHSEATGEEPSSSLREYPSLLRLHNPRPSRRAGLAPVGSGPNTPAPG